MSKLEYELLLAPSEVNFAPENEVIEILQNVATICSTQKYSVPMDRLFGVDATMLDSPTPKAMAAIQAEIVQAVRKYEPRCRVKKVILDGDVDGKLSVKVRIEIGEE